MRILSGRVCLDLLALIYLLFEAGKTFPPSRCKCVLDTRLLQWSFMLVGALCLDIFYACTCTVRVPGAPPSPPAPPASAPPATPPHHATPPTARHWALTVPSQKIKQLDLEGSAKARDSASPLAVAHMSLESGCEGKPPFTPPPQHPTAEHQPAPAV